MLHSLRSLQAERATSPRGYWSIAITSTLVFIVGVGAAEAGSRSPSFTNQSVYTPPKTYNTTPSSPSINRGRLNRALGSVRGGGSSRFSIDRSRLTKTKTKKKARRRYGRRRTNKLPKAPRLVRLKKMLKKRVSKAIATAAPSAPVGVDLQVATVGPAAGLVMTLIPPTFDTRFVRELSMWQQLKDAAQYSNALLDQSHLHRAGDMMFGNPFRDESGPSDPSGDAEGQLDGKFSRGIGSWFRDRQENAGVGWKGYAFLANSHSRPVPGAAPVAVTPDSIASAMSGVAGRDIGAPTGPFNRRYTGPGGTLHHEFTEPNDYGGLSIVHKVRYPNGTMSVARSYYDSFGDLLERTYNNPNDSEPRRPPHEVFPPEYQDDDGDVVIPYNGPSGKQTDGKPTGTKPEKDFTKLYDPDSGDGGGWAPAWCRGDYCGHKGIVSTGDILAGMPGTKHELRFGEGYNGRAPRRTGPMIVNQHDLVAKYDPESQNHGRSGSTNQNDPCRYALCGDGANWP